MKIAVTGATGFVGTAAVNALLDAGHSVAALLRKGRSSTGQAWAARTGVTLHATGLHNSPELVTALQGADAVVHIAAALSGDYAQQYADSVETTRQLMQAMRQAGVRRLVGISSFSVYDYATPAPGSLLDEQSAFESQPERRTAYARAKCAQDERFREFAREPGSTCIILRPGIVYDAQRLWTPALGHALGSRRWVALGPDAALPLVHVDDVAAAISLAVQTPAADGQVLNLVEDTPPARRELIAALNASALPHRQVVGLPWPLHRALAALAAFAASLLGRRLPGLLDPVELAVRFKPLRYDNARARRVLGWQPRRRALAVVASASSP